MKLIPPVPSPLTKSSGERLFFDVLTKVDLPGWTAYHSLSVSEHEYKRWGELDFVIISTEGLLALEVKGGRVAAAEGLWTFTDRYGEEHIRQESPFKQAETGIMGLKQRLEQSIPQGQLRALPLGYGVVFPQTDFGVVSVEWAQETVLDKARMSSPEAVAKWLRRLAKHWQEKTHIGGDAPAELVHQVRDLLRPSFERAPSLRYRVDEAVILMDRLTEEQYRQLDFIEDSPRLVCEGGAGTGKTFLAAELARRRALLGERVLFTCWSPVLAAFVRSRVPAEVAVVPWADLSKVPGAPFDMLIVDEAQDVLSIDALSSLNGLVRRGLEEGRWAIFLDPNAQSAVRSAMEPEALELLRIYGGVPGRLRWNCRNTEPIVIQTRLLTGADLGNPSAGFGPPVQYAPYEDSTECAAMLEAHLDGLVRDGVGLGEITILSTRPLVDSAAWKMSQKWRSRLREISPSNAGQMPLATLTFAQIEDFKGLENSHIAVVDIDRFSASPRDLALVYVAMSRARAGLWVAYRGELADEIQQAAATRMADVANPEGKAS